ncbi:cytochrome P450 [Nonomuraea longicatena]|uniref:Cytochrome P450 n=1 Tax=Nonomuraea longicatena TaxID=83682 RepID=A0ABP4A5N8_9ACTN
MTSGHIILDPTGTRTYSQFDELRDLGSAVLVELPAGVIAWSVSRGDVVRKLLTDPRVSKDARASWPGYQPYRIAWLTVWVDVISMLTSDGPDHKRLRDLVGRAFTPRRVEALRPAVEAIVTDLLEDLGTEPPDVTVDLRERFSIPVPSGVICDLFGVPDPQRPNIVRLMDSVLDTSLTDAQADIVRRALFAAMNTLIDGKLDTPGDDMTSLLLTAHTDTGAALSRDELVSTLILMIGAGSETTVSLINHAVVALLTHPGQLAAVAADPARWSDVIDESLRQHPPVAHLPLRYATDDIDLGDVVIPAGDPILIAFGAHGRDPRTNPDPDVFAIDRADREHLAFGHGIHYCLGAPLARLEASVALPALFRAFPGMRLDCPPEDLTPQPSFITNDYRRLPVTLGPRPTAPFTSADADRDDM